MRRAAAGGLLGSRPVLMDWNRRTGRIAAAIVLVVAGGLVLAGLSSFGIWDPWELSAADLGRQVATGADAALERPPLATWLIARGFAVFGVHEWSGRLPLALAGLAAVALAYLLVARFAGRRAGAWAAVVTATTPLFLLNARQMLGAAPGFAASAAVFLCASAAVFAPARLRAPEERRRAFTAAWLVGLAFSAVLATLANGVLLGLAPPLLGVAVAIVARGELTPSWADVRRTGAAALVLAAAAVAAGGAAHAVWADYAGFGFWTGGVPRGGDPPTWEVGVERLFHSFAPWSALLPLALARMLAGRPTREAAPPAPTVGGARARVTVDHPEEGALRLALVGWIGFGFLAQTLFTARYGPATFLPVVGAAAAVGLLLRDVERTPRAWWGTALVAFLFVGLLIRDFGKYPTGPVEGLVAEGLEVPSVFNPAGRWAVALGAFAALLALGLAADPAASRENGRVSVRRLLESLIAPVRLVRRQWERGPAFVLWLLALALLAASTVVIGLLALLIPETLETQLGMTSLGLRIGAASLGLVPALAVLVALARAALWLFGALGSYRLVPAIASALLVAGYVSFGFQPDLSSHFSPREVYDSYNELASSGEPLGEFRVGGRAAAYYATGDVVELETQAALIDFLRQERRVWAAFRADDLAAINREYRQRTGQHLFVADARSARMILATNRAVEGLHNRNYLADAILDEPPRPQHPVVVNFDNRVELLGIDLDLPHGTYVGPGEAFRITWYFRVNAPVPGGYQPFVHIDGPGQRINGDHEPVDGRYPLRLWEPGDIIVDRQELRVPANYRRGDLTIYMGFYSGEQRLEIVSGPEDDVNRARVGTLPVR